MLQNWKNKFNAKCVTSAIDDIKVAITNVEVKATIIRSVKSSTLKKNDKYPTNIKRKVGAMVLDKWYSILRRKTTLALAWLILSTFDKRKLELTNKKNFWNEKKIYYRSCKQCHLLNFIFHQFLISQKFNT